MNIGIFLGHPAHFHYIKNIAVQLRTDGHNVFFAIKKKDILEQLMKNFGFEYIMIRSDRGNSKISMIKSVLIMEINMIRFVKRYKIELLIGTTLTFAARCICRIPVLILEEDDARVVPLYSKIALPFASEILTPVVCDNWKWNQKSIKYSSYHELAYLHPNHFTPLAEVVRKAGIDSMKPYFIIRFSSLGAHHDKGIKGINGGVAQRLVDLLIPYGDVYITSERELEPQFEQYRIRINPLDMHHVMAFAQLYIGDSQTMAAEAGVLGVPFVRFNDFVGRIGYLRELEDVYHLGYGVKASAEGPERMYRVVEQLLNMQNRKEVFQQRRQKMLSEKIDYAKFLTWFVENYPDSKWIMKDNPDYQYNFR